MDFIINCIEVAIGLGFGVGLFLIIVYLIANLLSKANKK